MQNFQKKNEQIHQAFVQLKADSPKKLTDKLNFSWSNWGFGSESLVHSARRLADNGLKYIELHGNRYGPDLGYDAKEVNRILADHQLICSGICGMFGPENELASNRPIVRQNAIDYIKRNLELAQEVGAKYFLIVPGAVGRPEKLDDSEFDRSVETLRIVAPLFEQAGVRGAVEPIRSAEVSIVHTFADALEYIRVLDAPEIQHINGDLYHMQVEEVHIAETILQSGGRLTNLHLADSNRRALGQGSLDIDTVIMALYLIGYNNENCFITAEPLGPGGDPYPAMYGRGDRKLLDSLVSVTASTWNERERYVRGL